MHAGMWGHSLRGGGGGARTLTLGLAHLHSHEHGIWQLNDTDVAEPMKDKQNDDVLLQPSRSHQAMLVIQNRNSTLTPSTMYARAPSIYVPSPPFPRSITRYNTNTRLRTQETRYSICLVTPFGFHCPALRKPDDLHPVPTRTPAPVPDPVPDPRPAPQSQSRPGNDFLPEPEPG